jgi:hypothetical protein
MSTVEAPMLRSIRRSLLAASVLVAAPFAMADDAAVAAGLVGTWEGTWTYDTSGGRLVVKITASNGASLKGESMWYGTVVGDFKDTFSKAKVKGQKVEVGEPTMDFEATLSEDGRTLTGTWTSPMATGGLTLTKKPS